MNVINKWMFKPILNCKPSKNESRDTYLSFLIVLISFAMAIGALLIA